MPRTQGNFKVYDRIMPSPLLDITDLVDGKLNQRKKIIVQPIHNLFLSGMPTSNTEGKGELNEDVRK